MSVTSTANRIGPILLTALPQTVAVTFPFQQSSDLLVIDIGPVGGLFTSPKTLALGSDYTVTGGGYNSSVQMQSGSIVVVSTGSSAVAVNDQIVILRNVPVNQTSSFSSAGPLTISLIEQALDKQATISQEITEEFSRSLSFPQGDTATSGIPAVPLRAGLILGFDANGNAVVVSPLQVGAAVVVPVMVSSIAALRALSVTGLSTGFQVPLSGYYAPGDGGGGLFTYDSTIVAGWDAGSVIQPTVGAGGWRRVFTDGVSNPRFWGATGNWNGTTGNDDTTAFQAALNWLNSGSFAGRMFIPKGAYKITASLTLGNALGASRPVVIQGSGQGTQLINLAAGSNPTWAMKGVTFWTLRDMLLTGNSTNKNDGVLVAFDGSSNSSDRFLIENVVAEMAGIGFNLQNCNTGVLRSCKSWPSSNSSGATVPPVVTQSDISHGIYMTGGYCNDISIYDFDNEPTSTYAAGMCSIKHDATLSQCIRIYGGVMEGSGTATIGTGRYSINLSGFLQFGVISGCFLENTDLLLSGCRYITMQSCDLSGNPNTLHLTGNAASNLLQSVYVGTILIDSGCSNNVLDNCGVFTALTDNGTATVTRNCGGAANLPDRGGQKVAFAATLVTPQSMGNGAITIVLFDTKQTDVFNAYTIATGRLLPAVPGTYRVSASVSFATITDLKEMWLGLYKNGVLYSRVLSTAGATDQAGMTWTGLVTANATDYFDVRVFNGDTANQNLSNAIFAAELV